MVVGLHVGNRLVQHDVHMGRPGLVALSGTGRRDVHVGGRPGLVASTGAGRREVLLVILLGFYFLLFVLITTVVVVMVGWDRPFVHYKKRKNLKIFTIKHKTLNINDQISYVMLMLHGGLHS